MIARLKNDFFQGTSPLPFGNVLRRGFVLDGDLWICNNTVGWVYKDIISSFCCGGFAAIFEFCGNANENFDEISCSWIPLLKD